MNLRMSVLAGGWCLGLIGGAAAQNPTGDSVRIHSMQDVRATLDALAKRSGARIVYDRSVQGKVDPLTTSETVSGLDAICKAVPGLVWRKVLLRKGAAEPTAETLAGYVRALININLLGIAMSRPGEPSTLFLSGEINPDSEFAGTPVFVVLNNKAAAATEKLQGSLTDAGMAQFRDTLFATMTPVERMKFFDSLRHMERETIRQMTPEELEGFGIERNEDGTMIRRIIREGGPGPHRP